MIVSETAARAKPLNANTLAALPYGIRVWNDQIEYLADILANEDFKNWPADRRERIQKQHADLIRARDWVQSKIDTNTEH